VPPAPSQHRLPFETDDDANRVNDDDDDDDADADAELDEAALRYLEGLPLPTGGKTGSLPMPASRRKLVPPKPIAVAAGPSTALAPHPTADAAPGEAPVVPATPVVTAATPGPDAPATPSSTASSRFGGGKRPAPLVIPPKDLSRDHRENGIVSASAAAVRA
jgi:hypothetical protein